MIVTDMLRMNVVRLSCLIPLTANWQVNDEITRMIVAGTMRFRAPDSVNSVNGLRRCSNSCGGHSCAPVAGLTKFARMLKYAANSPAKNITSEVMNRSIPRTGFPMPPEPWAVAPGWASAWVSAVVSAAIGVAPSVRRGAAVPGVEDRALGADLREVVEVVRGRRRRGRPLEGVGLPRVVAGDPAAAQGDQDVPQERKHRERDHEPADRREHVELVPPGGRGVV